MTLHGWIRRLHRKLGLLLLMSLGVLGVAYALLLPPFQVPDERRHWLAAHHHLAKLVTGSGTVCSTDVALVHHFSLGIEFRRDAKLPSGTFSRIADLAPECEEKPQYPRSNVTTYPGVVLTRLFVPREPDTGRQSLFGFYLSRLLQGSLITLMLWRMWRLANTSSTGPPGLLALLLLSLSPLFVQQAFAVTNDVVTVAFALSICSFMAFPDRQKRLDVAVLLCLGLVAALTKPVLSIPLLPAFAVGLYLDRMRNDPEGQGSAIRAFADTLAKRWRLLICLFAISVVGLVYANGYIDLTKGRAAAQFAFILDNPWHALSAIASKFTSYFWHPSAFIDELGYLSLRIGAGTQVYFGALVAIVCLVELALGATQIHERLKRRDLQPPSRFTVGLVAALAVVAIASLAASALAIGTRAYLFHSRIGDDSRWLLVYRSARCPRRHSLPVK